MTEELMIRNAWVWVGDRLKYLSRPGSRSTYSALCEHALDPAVRMFGGAVYINKAVRWRYCVWNSVRPAWPMPGEMTPEMAAMLCRWPNDPPPFVVETDRDVAFMKALHLLETS